MSFSANQQVWPEHVHNVHHLLPYDWFVGIWTMSWSCKRREGTDMTWLAWCTRIVSYLGAQKFPYRCAITENDIKQRNKGHWQISRTYSHKTDGWKKKVMSTKTGCSGQEQQRTTKDERDQHTLRSGEGISQQLNHIPCCARDILDYLVVMWQMLESPYFTTLWLWTPLTKPAGEQGFDEMVKNEQEWLGFSALN